MPCRNFAAILRKYEARSGHFVILAWLSIASTAGPNAPKPGVLVVLGELEAFPPELEDVGEVELDFRPPSQSQFGIAGQGHKLLALAGVPCPCTVKQVKPKKQIMRIHLFIFMTA
jgi:hypothetical protein